MNVSGCKVAICYLKYGPYHFARLNYVRRCIVGKRVVGVQMARNDDEYAWTAGDSTVLETVELDRPIELVSPSDWRRQVSATLDRIQPDCCAVAGYSHPSMLAVIDWCRRVRCPAVLMSDSTAWDAPRHFWKEWIKRRLVSHCSAGFVAGQPHIDYLAGLGMPRSRIWIGYDVVDNEYFATQAEAARANAGDVRKRLGLPDRYFVTSARFIEKKNLPLLIRAYSRFRELAKPDHQIASELPHLVIVGDGPMRSQLEALGCSLGLRENLHLPGFKQYDELPAYYALAEALIHASTVDQWGLVVNEGMACSLPVLVSNRSGCASSLVVEGENGHTFDPYNEAGLTNFMLQMARHSPEARRQMGRRSVEIVAGFGLPRFAEGLSNAVDSALATKRPATQPLNALTLRAIQRASR